MSGTITLKVGIGLLLSCLACAAAAQANDPPPSADATDSDDAAGNHFVRQGNVTAEWGYERAFYTNSTINFRGAGYQFRLDNVAGSDHAQMSNIVDLFNTVAQYNFRFGYQLTNDWKLSAGLDHMKYDMRPQVAAVTGNVAPSVSSPYAGTYQHTLMAVAQPGDMISQYYLHNGLNLADIEATYTRDLYVAPAQRFALSANGSLGVGPMIPRSEIIMFDKTTHQPWHFAGIGVAGVVALHADILKYVFLEAKLKGGYVALPDVLTVGNGRASQSFGFLEPLAVLGVNLPVERWANGR